MSHCLHQCILVWRNAVEDYFRHAEAILCQEVPLPVCCLMLFLLSYYLFLVKLAEVLLVSWEFRVALKCFAVCNTALLFPVFSNFFFCEFRLVHHNTCCRSEHLPQLPTVSKQEESSSETDDADREVAEMTQNVVSPEKAVKEVAAVQDRDKHKWVSWSFSRSEDLFPVGMREVDSHWTVTEWRADLWSGSKLNKDRGSSRSVVDHGFMFLLRQRFGPPTPYWRNKIMAFRKKSSRDRDLWVMPYMLTLTSKFSWRDNQILQMHSLLWTGTLAACLHCYRMFQKWFFQALRWNGGEHSYVAGVRSASTTETTSEKSTQRKSESELTISRKNAA